MLIHPGHFVAKGRREVLLMPSIDVHERRDAAVDVLRLLFARGDFHKDAR